MKSLSQVVVSSCIIAFASLQQCIPDANAFAPSTSTITSRAQRTFDFQTKSVMNTSTSSPSALKMTSTDVDDQTPIATLTEDTTWRLRFSLNSVPTLKGKKVGELFVVDVKFIEEEGYEPPQGDIIQVKKTSADSDGRQNVQYLNVKSGRWKLSEDPDERKDGLWVWGLFKEPLYPFMLLQIETEAYQLPTNDEEDGDSIQPLTLYAQINHKRDRDTGRVALDAASLNIREVESIKADPFGAARVDIFEDVKVGQLSLRALLPSDQQGNENGVTNNAVL